MNAIQFLEALISVSLQAMVVIIATECLSLQTSTRQRPRMWTACFVILLLLAASAAALPHLRWLPRLPWNQADIVPLVEFEQHVGGWMFVVWATGAGVVLALIATRMVLIARFLGSCQPLELAPGQGSEVAGGRTFRWMSSTRVEGPFCWQFHRPVIVVPHDMLSLKRHELAMVFRHEMEHLRMQHPLQHFLQHLVEAMLWFHPLVWRAARQAALARELACDEAAIDAPEDVVCYLRILLRIVERHASPPSPRGAVLGLVWDRGLLIHRAHRLVELARDGGVRHPPSKLAVPLLITVSAAAAALWLPINGLASPRAAWSPWPHWSASALHGMGLDVRDFEVYDRRLELHDVRRDVVRRGAP